MGRKKAKKEKLKRGHSKWEKEEDESDCESTENEREGVRREGGVKIPKLFKKSHPLLFSFLPVPTLSTQIPLFQIRSDDVIQWFSQEWTSSCHYKGVR